MSNEEMVDRWIADVHKVAEESAERTHYFHTQIGVTLASGCGIKYDKCNDKSE